MKCSYSILQEPWWWDATALRGWEQAVVELDGQIIARWPYSRMRGPRGIVMLASPPLTNRAGPWIGPLDGKQATRYSRTAELLDKLLEQLPRFHWFAQNMHPTLDYWMPMFWHGFRIEARATYVIEDCEDPAALEANLEEAARRQIRKGRRQLGIEEIDAGQLSDLVQMTFERQGHGMRVSPEVIESVLSAVGERDAGRAIAAVDRSGYFHAGALFVWDASTMFYLIGGGDPSLRSSGAGTFVLWEGLLDAGRRGLSFDFEGSMIAGVERFFRRFGAVQKPYIRLTKGSPLVRTGLALAKTLRK